MEIEGEEIKIQAGTLSLLCPETARNPEFLELLLIMILHISAQLHIQEDQSFSFFSSMDGMIHHLLKIIKNKRKGDYRLYNEAALQKTSDIFVFMISNQDVMRNYNLIDKFIKAIVKDARIYEQGQRQVHFLKGSWKEITRKEQEEIISKWIIVLDELFFAATTPARTLARQITSSEIFEVLAPILIEKTKEEKDEMSPLLKESMSLITTLCNEVPDLIVKFVDLGLIEAYLQKFNQRIPHDKMLYLLSFFIAVIRRNEKGAKLLD